MGSLDDIFGATGDDFVPRHNPSIISGGGKGCFSCPRPLPPVYIPSPPRTEYIAKRVKHFYSKHFYSEDRLERIRQDEMAERKLIREADERMKRLVMEKTDENQKIHDERMAKAQTEFNDKLQKLNEEHLKKRGQSTAEHKSAMLKLEAEFKEQKEQLDAKLEKSQKECDEMIRNMENGCQQLKTTHKEEIGNQLRKISNAELKNRQEIREVRNEQDRLRNEMFEEQRAHRKLELNKQVETCERLVDDLEQIYIEGATKEMLKKFVNVMESAQEVGQRLQQIQYFCDVEITDDSSSKAKFYINEFSQAKNEFQTRVNQLRGYVRNDDRCHPEGVQICSNYVRQYEQLVNGSILTRLTIQLPNAIKAKNVSKVKAFGKQAEDMSMQIEKIRKDEIGKLREIKDVSGMGRIEG